MIVVLNGGSSSGKTSIARSLTTTLGAGWLRLSVDDFVDALSPALWDSPDGLVIDEHGGVQPGSQFRALEAAWLCGLSAMSRAGAHLVLDDVLLDEGESQRRVAAVLGEDVVWIGVRCDPDVAAARELARGDRKAGMARKQAEVVHRGVEYDLVVDSGTAGASDCARTIARYLDRA